MSKLDGTQIGLISLATAFVVASVPLILADNSSFIISGVCLLIAGIAWIFYLFYKQIEKNERNEIAFKNEIDSQYQRFQKEISDQHKVFGQQIERILGSFGESSQVQFDHFSDNTRLLMESYNLKNDAMFIKDGFIGLQQQVNLIELAGGIDKGHDRLAILGHLPSYMRRNDLDMKMGNILYSNWHPPHLIAEYVRLVNQRKEAFHNFVEHKGQVRDIFSKHAITQYVIEGCTFHDQIEDPVEEIEERLNALLYYISKPNYHICMLEDPRKTPNYIMKQGIGLVIDTRTAEITSHFTNSIDGVYTDSPQILEAFEKKFELSWQPDQANKEEIKKFLHNLQSQVADYKKERERRGKK